MYFVSFEALQGKPQEFKTLRFHDPDSGRFEVLSAAIPWDVGGFTIADDGKHLAFTSNEDGISRLRVLSLPGHKEIRLPALPIGVIGGLSFSPDGKRLALTLNSATSPSDVYVIDLAASTATRWTQSEVGGLDASKFVAPTLVRYPTFDKVDGKQRTIPAFFYKPVKPSGTLASKTGKYPVVINIHGGPESQSLPTFNATAQYLANELG